MEHPLLDNPAWNALISGNGNLSFGNSEVKYFDAEVSPFAAFKENTTENFQQDCMICFRKTGRFCLSRPAQIEIPAGMENSARYSWCPNGLRRRKMIYSRKSKHNDLVHTNGLGTFLPQMLELTQLTNPGPFASKTIDFGHYQGIFEDDQLVAMAGQRLHTFNYTEVSAVCTRPGYTGKSYARQLILNQVNRIKAAGDIPYLHSRADNERAISVYESLGFETRIEVWFYLLW